MSLTFATTYTKEESKSTTAIHKNLSKSNQSVSSNSSGKSKSNSRSSSNRSSSNNNNNNLKDNLKKDNLNQILRKLYVHYYYKKTVLASASQPFDHHLRFQKFIYFGLAYRIFWPAFGCCALQMLVKVLKLSQKHNIPKINLKTYQQTGTMKSIPLQWNGGEEGLWLSSKSGFNWSVCWMPKRV